MSSETVEPREIRAELIGRDEELAFLRGRLEEADSGAGSVVFVTGEAGLGKKRLLEAVREEAGSRGLRVLTGACRSERRGMAYGLFADVLRHFLESARGGARLVVQEFVASLAPHLWEVLFPDQELPQAFQQADIQPELRQSLFLARLGRLLLALGDRQPVLLCLENMHRADSASLQMVRYLASHNAGARLVMVVTGDLEEDAGGPSAALKRLAQELQSQTHVHLLSLQPLDLEETRALVASVFGRHGFSDGMLRLLHTKSGGAPLSILQYLEYLQDKKLIYEKRGLWVSQKLEERQEPTSIRATLRQRLERLPEEERRVLSHAAVQGERFAGRLVARTLAQPLTGVLRTLSQLLRRTRLLRIDNEQFCFVHPLLAEVCYDFLTEPEQRRAHLLLGNILEQNGERGPEVLGFHFYQAGAFSRALEYLLEAGQRARKAFAFVEARGFLEQGREAFAALDSGAPQGQLQEILLQLADIEDRTGNPEAALALCRQVLEESGDDRAAVGRALMQMGWVEYRKGNWEETTRLCEETVEIFTEQGDESRIALVHLRLGNIAFEHGDLEQAEKRFQEAKDTAVKCANHYLLGSIYGNLGIIASVRGQFVEAVLHYTEALKAYRKIDHKYGLCQTFHNLGMMHADQGKWPEALKWYDRGEKQAREMGTVDVEANILVSRAEAETMEGDLEGAGASCAKALVYMEQLGDRLGVAECRKIEGMILRERAEYERAEDRLVQGRTLFEELGNRLGMAECDLELGRLEQARGDADEARLRLVEAQTRFGEVGAEEDARRVGELLAGLVS